MERATASQIAAAAEHLSLDAEAAPVGVGEGAPGAATATNDVLATDASSGSADKTPPVATVADEASKAEEEYMSTLVQYIVMRKDLFKMKHFNKGAVLTQGAHACTAVMWTFRQDKLVEQYFAKMDSMHKVALQVKGAEELHNTATMLARHKIDHLVWIEQPENIPTCLATKPYPRRVIAPLLRALKLLR